MKQKQTAEKLRMVGLIGALAIIILMAIFGCSKEEDSPPECECLEIRKFNQIFYVDINCYDLEELELPPDFVEQFIEKASEKQLNIFQNNADCVR